MCPRSLCGRLGQVFWVGYRPEVAILTNSSQRGRQPSKAASAPLLVKPLAGHRSTYCPLRILVQARFTRRVNSCDGGW